jgi:hypothetical protein
MHEQTEPTAGDLVSFDVWIQTLNRTRATGHRWRRQLPWLKTVNIFGKLYIRRATIEEFERRASAGEFQRDFRPNPNPMVALLPHPGRPRKKARA